MATALAPGRGLDERPRPCPKCGRTPRLVTGRSAAGVNCTARYECRRWFGLALCRRGSEAVETIGSEGWARRAAAVKWNRGILWSAPRAGLAWRSGLTWAFVVGWPALAVGLTVAGATWGAVGLMVPGVAALVFWAQCIKRACSP